MTERFVSEVIKPAQGTSDTGGVIAGEPGIPGRFTWRDNEYQVDTIMEKWKDTSPCRHGSDEQYVRKHWFRIRTTSGEEMKLYFERQARSKRERKQRWWLFSVGETEN